VRGGRSSRLMPYGTVSAEHSAVYQETRMDRLRLLFQIVCNLRFSLVFAVLLILHFGIVFPFVFTFLARRSVVGWQPSTIISSIGLASLTLGLAALGLLLSYGIAAKLYPYWRPRLLRASTVIRPVVPTPSSDGDIDSSNPFSGYDSIGIVLAGGGAKGVYQAGAMKAIWEFLDTHHAHHKVRMIAGTSIGSWNALFWLAGLVKSVDGNPSAHEAWWRSMSVKGVIQPTWYTPLWQNYLLSNAPWRKAFDLLFRDSAGVNERLRYHIDHPDAEDALHFYLTRSNVKLARLEFTTNRQGLDRVPENLTSGRRSRPPVPPGTFTIAKSLDDVREGVFASMDLPPLFPYVQVGAGLFEDGGVVDNLPIRFGTEIEQCDLLFVLPLNATFATMPDVRRVIRRLLRVMDVRQGVLERNAFKLIYLYNELAGLRIQAKQYEELLIGAEGRLSGVDPGRASEVRAQLNAVAQIQAGDGPTARALRRRHRPVRIFAICPAPKLAVGTIDFWKTRDAGLAFDLMYSATGRELAKFDFQKPSEWLQMALVSPVGEVTHFEDF
jgi:predicted acylesterase/phospholipase RssA